VEIVPHRAVYRLLAADPASAAGERPEGMLAVEWRADCRGWESRQRMVLRLAGAEGATRALELRFWSFESRDGTRLRFSLRSQGDARGGAIRFAGEARLPEPGAAGEVRFSAPEGVTLALSEGVRFPLAHLRRLIEAARAGRTTVRDLLFDGTGPSGMSLVAAAIGPLTGDRSAARSRWPVALVYYPANGDTLLPTFAMRFLLEETGILRELEMDYGRFRVRGELELLELLPLPACGLEAE